MTQIDYQTKDFSYASDIGTGATDSAGLPARVAIFADRPSVRDQIAQDLGGAGFRTIDGGDVVQLLDGPIAMLGDVVMVDCPVVDARHIAALARLDMRVARAGAQLIVSTAIDSLDDVFSALDQCDPQILVQPSRAERVIAVGRVMAEMGSARVREMTEEDRLNLLHLSRQVEAIAHKLEGLSSHQGRGGSQAALRAHASDKGALLAGAQAAEQSLESGQDRIGSARPPLPDPRRVRQVIAARQARAKFFDKDLFADPAWDMLLDLTAAHAEHQRVSVTSLCIAAEVPATTALRWIKQLVDSGVFVRVADSTDRRRAFIGLSDQSAEAMARYFAEIETPMLMAA
ncbi:MarR family transcriptional regulator [Qipengyuania nanhaisediminis]|uniref:MarR family transcriptional regulator n=1 Tax=Qipengyuania nanhaisediminis TaxID=604088 RepID=UPI0038B3057D